VQTLRLLRRPTAARTKITKFTKIAKTNAVPS
jgi:hypothetical protein